MRGHADPIHMLISRLTDCSDYCDATYSMATNSVLKFDDWQNSKTCNLLSGECYSGLLHGSLECLARF